MTFRLVLPVESKEVSLLCRSAIRIIVTIFGRSARLALPRRAIISAKKRHDSIHSIAKEAEKSTAAGCVGSKHIADQAG
jgi:hypothetical protein